MRRQACLWDSFSERKAQARAYSGSRKELVTIDGTRQGLGLAAQGVNDMPVIDAVKPAATNAPAQAGMGDDMRRAEPGLDTVVVDMHPQALSDELGGHGVEDAVNQEAAGSDNPHHEFGKVRGAPLGQRLQLRQLDFDPVLAAAVAAGDNLVDQTGARRRYRENPGTRAGSGPGRARPLR